MAWTDSVDRGCREWRVAGSNALEMPLATPYTGGSSMKSSYLRCPGGASRWLHQDLPHRAKRTFGLPITVITPDDPQGWLTQFYGFHIRTTGVSWFWAQGDTCRQWTAEWLATGTACSRLRSVGVMFQRAWSEMAPLPAAGTRCLGGAEGI
jgi:hypothetical protein